MIPIFWRAVYRRSDDNPYGCGRSVLAMGAFEPGDEIAGGWTRDALVKMNADFIAAMKRAIARGLERRPPEDPPARAT